MMIMRKIKNENDKLKKNLEKLSTKGGIVMEKKSGDHAMIMRCLEK